MQVQVLDRDLYREELGSGGFGPRKPGDAGVDLRCSRDVRIEPFGSAVIPLGIAVAIPDTCVGWMTGRSSLTATFGAISTEGKIDAGYRGEVHHFVHALNRPVQIARGERICQLILVPIITPDEEIWEIANELDETERGTRGLGSTGRD